MHLTALWGKWNTSNIENHLGGNRCVIFDHIIQSRCLSYRGGSQPAREEHPFLPTGQWGTAAVWGDRAHQTLKTMSGGPDVLFRDKYSFLDICIICDTPNRPFRNIPLLPTGHWGMDAFDTTMGQVKHIKHWKPSRGAQMCNFWTHNSNLISADRGDSQPASEERPLLPTGHWGTTAVWGDRAHSTLRTLSGGPDVLFRITNNRLLIYPWCVILPTGQWGTHHCSQSAAEEWMHFKEI